MTATLSHAELEGRLKALARLTRTESPVVSVYLETHPGLARVDGVAALLRYPL